MKLVNKSFNCLISLSDALIFPIAEYSQIQGSVRDRDNKPVSYANVLLINQKDSTVISGLMGTEEGTYAITNFKPGTYILEVNMIGYKPAYSPPFVIKSSKDHHHIEPIIVEEDGGQVTKLSKLENPSSDTWQQGMGNINLQHYFKEDESLEVNLDYL